MPIELHCQHCNKLVRAPDNAAGKRAKCPYCQQEVYVPTPPEKIDELELAPLDEGWKDEKRRLEEEAKQVSEALRQEKGVPENGGPARGAAGAGEIPVAGEGAGAGGAAGLGPDPSGSGVERMVIAYLVAMKNSRLEEAEALGKKLAARAAEAKSYAQQLSMDPMPPPELADLAPGLLKGLLKKLLAQL